MSVRYPIQSFVSRFDSQILQHDWKSGKLEQKKDLSKLNQPEGDPTYIVNPPFITSLKMSPTHDHLGFALGNGSIGALRIFGM